MLSLLSMLSVVLPLATVAPGSEPYHWRSVSKEAHVNDLISPREGAHLIADSVYWDLNRVPAGARFENTESLSWAVDCPLLVVQPGTYTIDGGANWKPFTTEPSGAMGGSIVFNSTAQVIVWCTGGSIFRSFDFGRSWGKSEGLTGSFELVADGVTPTRTYALSGSELYSSDDTGGSFQSVTSIGLPSEHQRMRATENQVGDLWIPAQSGLFHSLNAGKVFRKLANVDSAESVGFGKAAAEKGYPAIFISGKIDGMGGVFRSDDEGQTWIRISDPAGKLDVHGIVTGDPRIFGRVYLGTKDHGILLGDLK